MAGRGIAKTMIRSLRGSPGVRLALGVAVLLAVGASFGLHPEPSGPGPAPLQDRFAAAAVETSGSHACVACLTFGAALVAPLSGIVLSGALSVAAAAMPGPGSPARLPGRDLSGRSPPSHS